MTQPQSLCIPLVIARAWRRGRRLVSPLAILALWQVLTTTRVIDPDFLPPPDRVVAQFIAYAGNGELFTHVWTSFLRVMAGLALGISAGTVLGLLSGLSRGLDDAIDPPLQMIKAVPTLGLLPLLVIWVGIDEALKVSLVALGVLFPIYINVAKGIRSVDPRLGELARTLGVRRARLIREIVLPGAWPHFLIGLRFALSISWLSLVFSEAIASTSGIGFLLNQARQFNQIDVILLCLVLYALLGLLFESLVRLIERVTLQWKPEFVQP